MRKLRTKYLDEGDTPPQPDDTENAGAETVPKSELEAKVAEFEAAKAEWEKQKNDLEEAADPNWQKTRQRIKTLETALKEKGVKFDGEGNIESAPQKIDVEQIRKEAVDAAKQTIFGNALDAALSEYDKDSQEVIRHFYKKITSGEEVNSSNLQTFVDQAVQAASVGNEISKVSDAAGGTGGGPRTKEETGQKLPDETEKELGGRMGLAFASEKQEGKK